jgi:hypothetical protein
MQSSEVMDGHCESQTEPIKTIFEEFLVSGFRREVDKNCITTQKTTFFNF